MDESLLINQKSLNIKHWRIDLVSRSDICMKNLWESSDRLTNGQWNWIVWIYLFIWIQIENILNYLQKFKSKIPKKSASKQLVSSLPEARENIAWVIVTSKLVDADEHRASQFNGWDVQLLEI